MEFPVKEQGDVVIVTLSGELDVSVAHQLKSVLREVIEKGSKKLIADLKEVKFIDSSCLGVLVNAHKLALERQGAIKFAQANQQVRKIFELTRTDKHLSFFATIDEAKQSFRS